MTPPPDLRPAFSIPSQEIQEPVPFSYELLQNLNISEKLFNTLEQRSRRHGPPYLSTLMTRQGGDATGLVPNLGAFHGPDDVKEVLLSITQPHIDHINSLKEQERQDIQKILGGSFSTPEALVIVDNIFGKIIRDLQRYRTKTSRDMRERTRQALGTSPLIRYVPTWEKGKLIGPGEWEKGRLLKLEQRYVVPPLSSESQAILQRITPDVFKMSLRDDIFPPLSPEGFLRNAGKLGNPMAREFAQYCIHLVKLQERFQQQDDLAKAAMQAYCESHP